MITKPASMPRYVRDILAIVVPLLVFAVLFFSNVNQLFLVTLMVYVVLSQGINIIYGFTGYLPFGYVAFFGAGAFGMSTSVIHWHLNAVVAMLFGGFVALILALVLAPMLRLRGAYFAIASLATALALNAIVGNPALQPLTHGENGVDVSSVFNATGAYIAAVIVMTISIAVVVVVKRMRIGLDFRAIRDDPVSAGMAGVNVVLRRTQAWLICAVLGGLIGGVYAWAVATFYPDAVFTFTISLFAIVFALFGGIGTVLGPVVGAVILYTVYNFVGVSTPQYFQLVYGILIVVIVLFFPRGLGALLPYLQRKFPRHRARRQAAGASDAG